MHVGRAHRRLISRCETHGDMNSAAVILHTFVSRSAGAFRGGPSDVVEGTLSLAGLAVQAVGRIGWFYLVVYRLIYTGGAEGDAGAVEARRALCLADIRVEDGQM